MKRWCYVIVESQDPKKHGGYVPSMVTENESGHAPLVGRDEFSAPWIWGKTLAQAKKVCKKVNRDRGISDTDEIEILFSSFRAQNLG